MPFRAFYSLVERDGPGEPWRIEFGDHELATVQAELKDYVDHDRQHANLRIIQTGGQQADVDAAIAILNRRGGAS